MYITLKEWIKREFKDPTPSYRTIQYLCQQNKIENARKIGRKWYVKVEEKNKGVNNEK